jgi:exonuclease III
MVNETVAINNYIVFNDIDLLALIETWLGNENDNVILSEPTGILCFTKSTKTPGRWFGSHILCYNKPIPTDAHFTHFEHLECTMASSNNHVRLCVTYHPQASKSNGFKNTVFFEEWSCYLDHLIIISKELIMTGNLNFHLDEFDTSLLTLKYDYEFNCKKVNFINSTQNEGLSTPCIALSFDGFVSISWHVYSIWVLSVVSHFSPDFLYF